MVAKLKAVSNKRSPEREALAQAIADAAVAERAAHKARDAKERAQSMVAAAEAKRSEATASIEKARDAQAAHLAKAAMSGAKPKADPLARNARIDAADAEDALEASKAAVETCEGALAESESELAYIQDIVAKCVDAVIFSESAASVLNETRMLQEKLIFARLRLQYLYKVSPESESNPFMVEAKKLLGFREFATWPGNVEYVNWSENQETLRLAALSAALSNNADAEV